MTGNDVAALHATADRHDCSWGAVPALPVPYVSDPDARMVYVDGRLPTPLYFEAVRSGLHEIVRGGRHADVIPLRRRRSG